MQHRAPLLEFPDDAWHQVIETNLTSAFHVGRAVARGMVERGRGKIVNIASLQSELARAGTAPYAASKGGIKMLTRAMCAEWAPAGLQVNAIGPGYFDTELTSALVDDEQFDAWLKQRTPAALGAAGGAGRHAALPRLARLRLRQRPDPLRRRRDVGGPLERFEGRAHDGRVGVDAGPVADPDRALVDEHPEAVEDRAAAGLGVADQARARRVRDHVGHDHLGRRRRDVEVDAGVDVGEEPDRASR